MSKGGYITDITRLKMLIDLANILYNCVYQNFKKGALYMFFHTDFGSSVLLVLFVITLSIYIYAFQDIYKSSFKNGWKDKLIFSILNFSFTPLAYYIFSYGHKTNLTQKQKAFFYNIESKSISFVVYVVLSVAVSTMFKPDEWGGNFLILMGALLFGVFFFHGLYPQHWDIYKEKPKSNAKPLGLGKVLFVGFIILNLVVIHFFFKYDTATAIYVNLLLFISVFSFEGNNTLSNESIFLLEK
jgi:hypothetical protein